MEKLNANGIKIETEYGKEFVDALRNRDKSMNLLLFTKDKEENMKLYKNYRKMDAEVRRIGRLIFGKEFDSIEGKHEDTSWRNLNYHNVKLIK